MSEDQFKELQRDLARATETLETVRAELQRISSGLEAKSEYRPTPKVRVEDLELTVRARSALAAFGVESVEHLCQLRAGQLCARRNFGVTSLLEVRQKLFAHGLHLRGDEFGTLGPLY